MIATMQEQECIKFFNFMEGHASSQMKGEPKIAEKKFYFTYIDGPDRETKVFHIPELSHVEFSHVTHQWMEWILHKSVELMTPAEIVKMRERYYIGPKSHDNH